MTPDGLRRSGSLASLGPHEYDAGGARAPLYARTLTNFLPSSRPQEVVSTCPAPAGRSSRAA